MAITANSNQPILLNATLRTAHGKGSSRRARAAGGVPAIVYGPGLPSLSVVISPKDLIKAMSGSLKRNALLALDVKDEAGKPSAKRTVMLKDIQIHPVKRVPTHVDFLEVKPSDNVAAKIPLEVTGKSKAIGQGAKMTLIVRTVTVSVKASDIPEKIVFDVTDEGFGVIRAKQMKVPAGTTLLDPPETPLVSIKIPRGDKEEEAAAAATAEGAAAPAAGAAAAPAAGAKGAAAAPAADAKGGDKKK